MRGAAVITHTHVSPGELHAKAKALRKEARALDDEATDIEERAIAEHRRTHSRQARESQAVTMCRPVWRSEGLEGVCVVVSIENGCFMVRDLMAVGGLVGPHPYRTRDGYYGGSLYEQAATAIRRARLDNVATMLNWRAFCASRKDA